MHSTHMFDKVLMKIATYTYVSPYVYTYVVLNEFISPVYTAVAIDQTT